VKATQAAVEVANVDAEEKSAQKAQYWIAKIAVQYGHRTGTNTAFEAVADHELMAFPELVDEVIQCAEVVAIVSITHDHVASLRRLDASSQRRTVAFLCNLHYTRAALSCDLA